MKKCSYCGIECPDESIVCPVDQRPLIDPTLNLNPVENHNSTWLRYSRPALRFVALILIGCFLYLLSFGPVCHFCGTMDYRNSMRPIITFDGAIITPRGIIDVRYPTWVKTLYYPALQMAFGRDSVGFYARYIQWWTPWPKNDFIHFPPLRS